MRKAVPIFLIVLMVSIQTPFGQLLKLPLLVEHYLKHQEKDGASFTSFLSDHYSTSHNDTDQSEDEQLPFKNITFYSIGYAIVTPEIYGSDIALLPMEKKIILPVPYTRQQHSASIFHPPKI